jgi:hypothetical protein
MYEVDKRSQSREAKNEGEYVLKIVYRSEDVKFVERNLDHRGTGYPYIPKLTGPAPTGYSNFNHSSLG